MDLKVTKGIVTYHGTQYKKDETISGVDKPTADYLLSMEVVIKVEINEASLETTESAPKHEKKSKQASGPKTSL